MKKTKAAILILALILSALLTVSCNKADPLYLAVDGDIDGGYTLIDLNKEKTERYVYDQDGGQAKGKGWKLNGLLSKITPLGGGFKLMITAEDGISALINYPLDGDIYIYLDEENKLCAKGPDYPRAVGIKRIEEITLISGEPVSEGYKIVSDEGERVVGRGSAKLTLFDLVAENKLNGLSADKYERAVDRSVSAVTGANKNIVYFKDYDIIKDDLSEQLCWSPGGLSYGGKEVFGFVTGTDRLISDVYYDMKNRIDDGKRVMVVLTDGFSWEQANLFSDSLSVLKPEFSAGVAASTRLAISPVALAAMVTGVSPFRNGVHFDEGESRAVLRPIVDDIFKYAADRGKSASYLEGSGNLILTSIEAQYAASDSLIYQNALAAVSGGSDLIFVHFHEIDDVNHLKGPLSAEAKTKVLVIESYIENLIAGFDGTVIVLSDHGHNTLYDSAGNAYGKHGTFTSKDMFVPYYVFEV